MHILNEKRLVGNDQDSLTPNLHHTNHCSCTGKKGWKDWKRLPLKKLRDDRGIFLIYLLLYCCHKEKEGNKKEITRSLRMGLDFCMASSKSILSTALCFSYYFIQGQHVYRDVCCLPTVAFVV